MKGTIALLTDFGGATWYVGVMKGVIAGINPEAAVIDLCHDVPAQDVAEGSFILGSACRYFPRGTIFVAVVDPGVGGARRGVVVRTDRFFFVAPDNGVLTDALDGSRVEAIREIAPGACTLPFRGSTFHGRDLFAPVAAHLSLGVDPAAVGREARGLVRLEERRPVVAAGAISGHAVHVDRFGNVVTNIDGAALARAFPGEAPGRDLVVRVAGRSIRGLVERYEQAPAGSLLALVNSWGLLEIAVAGGSALALLGAPDKKSLEITISRAL